MGAIARTGLFVSIVATGIALGPALAHLFKLPAKMVMGQGDYFTVQQVYAGWNRIAIVLLVQALGLVALVLTLHGGDRLLALGALLALIAAQIAFWVWTFPANQATRNWTAQPDNWEILRRQWEYSHAAGAGFQIAALAFLALLAARNLRG